MKGDSPPSAGLGRAPGPRCHLAVFAGFRAPYRPLSTHTFAAVAKVPPDSGTGMAATDLESISWLPSTLSIPGAITRKTPGVNLPLRATVGWARENRMSVSLWGPYPVRAELFDLFRRRAAELEAHSSYRAIGRFSRERSVANCVYGVRGAVVDRGWPVDVFTFGERATAETVRLLSPWILDTAPGGPDLLARFGLGEAEVIRRSYDYIGPTRLRALCSFLRPF